MALQAPSLLQAPPLAAQASADGRRLLALPGIVAVAGALLTAAISFAILMGATPIVPDETATLTLIAVNAAFVCVLLGLILREIHRIVLARRRGKAASRLHVRIVAMFSLVAALPRATPRLLATRLM